MKKLLLPLTVFVVGLVIADMAFDVDVPELFRGFGKFVLNILKGTKE